MAGDLTVEVGFDVHKEDLSAAVGEFYSDIGEEFSSMREAIADLSMTIRDMLAPMRDFRDLAKSVADSMKEAKEAAASIRESVGSARAGGGGGGGNLSSIGGMATMMGGAGVGGWLTPLIGGSLMGAGAIGLGQIANMDMTRAFSGGVGTLLSETFRGLGRSVGLLEGPNEGDPRRMNRLQDMLDPRQGAGWLSPIRAMQQGYSASEVFHAADTSQLMGLAGATQGLASSIGQGPVGLFSGVVGRGYGSQWGSQLAGRMFGGNELAMAAGGQIGGEFMQGMVGNYINQGMQRLPGYYATMSSMASPAMYGGNNREIRSLGLSRWGMGPEQVGPEFSSLYQGYGGGDLTRDTLQTSLAYSRAYGVSMGAQAQAIGGLINIGGGGQGATGEMREDIMLRVMSDAVATGFGRRLPEYAQAVSTSISAVIGGPAIMGQSAMQDVIESVSRVTGQVSREHGIGLQGAQRMIQPYAQAPGSMLRNMMTGGGDPFAMAQLWGANRGRFGGDVWAMQEGLASAQSDPFGAGMQFLSPMIGEQIRMSGGNRGVMGFGLQNMFQGLGMDMSFSGIQQIVNRGSGMYNQARAEGRELTNEEVMQALLGIETGQEDETASLQETMHDIQRSGEQIMHDQLRAMQASAGYAWQELGISAAMAEDAAHFHNMMAEYQRTAAVLMHESAIGSQLSAFTNMFGPESVASLRGGGLPAVQQWMEDAIGRLFEQTDTLGVDMEARERATARRLAESQERQRSVTRASGGDTTASYYGEDLVTPPSPARARRPVAAPGRAH